MFKHIKKNKKKNKTIKFNKNAKYEKKKWLS